MNGKLQVHGHCNGLKTTLLFALMWGVIMLIWWATGASQSTLGYYILIGLGSTFVSYWFSDKLAIASMHARQVSEREAPVLYKIVRELSAKAGKPMPRIYIAPTMSPNAFATGRNERHAAVCCTQGILQTLNEREIRGVLGHELMHVYNHDILTSAIASAMATYTDVAYAAGIPVYCGADSMVADGGFATIGVNYVQLGEQVADLVLEILDGADPAQLPYETLSDYAKYVNLQAAERFGADFDQAAYEGYEVLVEADGTSHFGQ